MTFVAVTQLTLLMLVDVRRSYMLVHLVPGLVSDGKDDKMMGDSERLRILK